MRAAPSVEVQSALRGGWWWAACTLWLAAAVALLAWLGGHLLGDGVREVTAQLPLFLGVLLLGLGVLSAAAAALWHARRQPVRLNWTGQGWVCTAPGELMDDTEAGQVDLMLDVGDAMLLRWRSAGPAEWPARTRWLPVARSGQAAAWHGLRVALNRPGGGGPGAAA